MKYVYEPLDKVPGAIRVLALQPAPHLDAPIQGSLEQVTHRTFPYIAISHVWGNLTITNWISLAGYEYGVGSNVFNVLRSVRRKSRTLFLWIDAICINQENIEERNTQVQDMANIYRNASEVIGWLGNKTLDFDAGFCLLKNLIAGSSHQYLEDKAYETLWDALVRLLDRPYWTRVWILQEIAINPRVSLRFEDDQESEITVQNLSEWDNIRFEVVSKWRELHSGQEWEGSLMQRFDVISNNVYNMGYLPSLYPLTIDEFQPLLQAHICNGPLATNPLDYIYGILGLFDMHVLSVDYSISPRDLYLRVIELNQHRTQQLDFLYWAWGGSVYDGSSTVSNTFNLPNWSIDFSYRTRFVRPIPLANCSRSQGLIWDTFYRASGETKQILRFDMANNSFVAKGVQVGSIDKIGSIADAKDSSTIWPQDWSSIGGLHRFLPPSTRLETNSKDLYLDRWSASSDTALTANPEAWWRTLFGDTLSREARIDSVEEDKQRIPPQDREGVENLCRHLTEYLQIQVHDGRRMFKTHDGRLGLAPPGAEAGDSICVFLGGDVPYILREVNTGIWEFIGECYLHEMMNGQALARVDNSLEFVVCG